jgi:glucokinase
MPKSFYQIALEKDLKEKEQFVINYLKKKALGQTPGAFLLFSSPTIKDKYHLTNNQVEAQ